MGSASWDPRNDFACIHPRLPLTLNITLVEATIEMSSSVDLILCGLTYELEAALL
jgi:hypothetical protein